MELTNPAALPGHAGLNAGGEARLLVTRHHSLGCSLVSGGQNYIAALVTDAELANQREARRTD